MLGSELVSELNGRGHGVEAPTRDEINIADPVSVASLASREFDWCFNCAAYTAVDQAEYEPDGAIAANALGPSYLARVCHMAGARLMHLSTDFVFDGSSEEPYTEEQPTNPLGVYARSKRDGEEAVLGSNPDAIVVRTAWLYGANGRCFPKTMIAAWLAGKRLRVVSDQVGSPTYAADLAVELALIAESGLAGGVYHAAGPDIMSWHDLAMLAIETYRDEVLREARQVDIEAISTADWPTPARRPLFSALSSQKLAFAGIGPMRSTKEAMLEFVHRIGKGPV